MDLRNNITGEYRSMWRDIEEFKGLYQISNQGEVRRIYRNGRFRQISLRIKNDCVCVMLRKNNKIYMRSVGKLVAIAFIGEPPVGTASIKHIDGDYTNNCLNNIRWNIPRAHTLPENIEARRLYDESCYSMMRAWAKRRNLLHFRINGYDIEDVFQEAAIKIWRYIDGYDSKRAGFFTFVWINCDATFNKLYKREINKPKNVAYIDAWNIEKYGQSQLAAGY